MTMFLVLLVVTGIIAIFSGTLKNKFEIGMFCLSIIMSVWLFAVVISELPEPIQTVNYQLVNRVDRNGQISQYYTEDGVEKLSPYKGAFFDTETCYVVKTHHRGWVYGVYFDLVVYNVKKGENHNE